MVNRRTYSAEYKNKLRAKMIGGISIAEINKEKTDFATLKRWKED